MGKGLIYKYNKDQKSDNICHDATCNNIVLETRVNTINETRFKDLYLKNLDTTLEVFDVRKI